MREVTVINQSSRIGSAHLAKSLTDLYAQGYAIVTTVPIENGTALILDREKPEPVKVEAIIAEQRKRVTHYVPDSAHVGIIGITLCGKNEDEINLARLDDTTDMWETVNCKDCLG